MPDREKVIEILESCVASPLHRKDDKYVISLDVRFVNAIIELLKEHGAEAKWIYGEDKTGVDGWYCSECNFFEPWFYEFTDDIDFIRFYGYCPKCGRRMTSYTGKPKVRK